MHLDDLNSAIDFVFACAVVHEMPEPEPFFRQTACALKPQATLLLVEPADHVDKAAFAAELAAATDAGLAIAGHPAMRSCRAALLRAPDTR